MADDDAGTPWAELHWGEQLWRIVWGFVGGVFCLAFLAVILAAAINETRWTFTRVDTERVCRPGERGDCLLRTPGTVSSIDADGFIVAIDRPPYRRDVTSLAGPAPPVGTRVVTEDWRGRLVSILAPARGRRHTNQWPNPSNDALEAVAA